MTTFRYTLAAVVLLTACQGDAPTAFDAPGLRAQHTHETRLQDVEFIPATLCIDPERCPSGVRVRLTLLRNFARGFTRLNYDVFEFVPGAGLVTYESGRGLIPDTDVAGNHRTGYRLRTNTDAASNPDYTRVGGDGGWIDVRIVPAGKFIVGSTTGGVHQGCTAGEVKNSFPAGVLRTAPAIATGLVFGSTGEHEKARIDVVRGNVVVHRINVPADCP